jgi:PAS domain S-box-containing protein
MAPRFHIAQANVAHMRAPLDDPIMAGFRSQLRLINAIAERSPGYVWRLQTDDGDATAIRAFPDPLVLINMSVWESPDALRSFVYRSAHARLLRDRAQWFVAQTVPIQVLWWVPAGEVPVVEEGVRRLELLRAHGPTADAFTFDTPFPPPQAVRAGGPAPAAPSGSERMRHLADRMPAIVWTTDRHLRFTAGFGAGLAGLGVKGHEVLGRTPDYFHTGGNGSPAIEVHRRALAGEACNYDLEWAGRVYQAHLEPLRDGDGSINGVIGVALDVTESRRTSDQLRDAHTHLDELVEEYAGELRRANERLQEEVSERRRAEHELRAAKEAAEAAARAKSDFLATMSHEIRNPMNAIIESADLLSRTELGAEQNQYATIVRRSAEVLLGLVDDILDLSKIEAGRLELKTGEFGIATVVEDVLDIFSARARMRGVELTAVTDARGPATAFGDAGRLRQVLINLVGNALKFTERGEVTIRTTATEVTPTHVHLRFEVHDTGIGIPRAQQERLFQPFSQIEDNGAPRPGGTGLGLAIAKRLTELMGGAIGVESDAGRGSTFWFTVVLETGAPTRTGLRLEVDPAQTPVLVIDDGATSRESLREALAAWGFPSDGASTGTEGLARLRAAVQAGRPIALVLLDVEMPGLRAFEFVQAVARDPVLRGTRVVLLVPFGQLRLERAALEAGASACFLKPLHPSRLRTCLETVLGVAGAEPRALRLPRREPASRVPAASISERTVVQGCAGAAAARVLLVEDDADLQLLTGRILERAGYQVDVVGDGREAVDAARRERYDLVLMDSRLPGLDGFQAALAIRAGEDSTGVRVPIIALTANAMEGDRQRCLEVGMDAVLQKPVKPDRLLATVADWTKQ